MKIRVNIDIKVGKLVKYFVLSDLFFLGGWGFIDPVFSVFIIQKIAGATLATVGIAAGIYWILKSIIQIPVANFLDEEKSGEKAAFTVLIGGLFLAGFSSLLFAFTEKIWALYLVQSARAIGFGLYGAAWPAIFSRHLDKDRISFDWSLDSTTAGLAAGATGLIGGIVAGAFGYASVFITAGVLSFIAAFVIMALPEVVLPKPTQKAVAPMDHTPGNLGV